jgi:K+-transporting ATPase ATPase A chain
MAFLAILLPAASILLLTALAVGVEAACPAASAPGRTASREILYAYTSATGNNGSAFAGLNANTPFYNITLGLAMWIGRFGVIMPASWQSPGAWRQEGCAALRRHFPDRRPLFTGMLVGVVVIVGALTFFPALSLGPIVEHLVMQGGIGW